MNQTAFVTGGTGFIGINLIKLLIDHDWKVTALYRDESDRSPLDGIPIHWVKGSITDANSLYKALPPETDTVFHLAGDTNMWSRRNHLQTSVNVAGTSNMVNVAVQHHVRTFIHTSSIAAWGQVSGQITETTEQKGNDSWINYERTKWAGERQALKGTDHGMKVVILNPANVVGPHDTNNWGRLFFALRDNDLPFVTNGCVSIAHVSEITRAHLAAVHKGKSGERYILAGHNCQFSEFVHTIAKVAGVNRKPRVIPAPLFRGYARLLSGWAALTGTEPTLTPELARLMTRNNVKYSSQKAKNQLGYQIPGMRVAVCDCYNWLKDEDLL